MEDLLSCVNVMNELLIGTPISEVAFRLERDVRPILTTQVKQHEEIILMRFWKHSLNLLQIVFIFLEKKIFSINQNLMMWIN